MFIAYSHDIQHYLIAKCIFPAARCVRTTSSVKTSLEVSHTAVTLACPTAFITTVYKFQMARMVLSGQINLPPDHITPSGPLPACTPP
jgi:hypothetical protein